MKNLLFCIPISPSRITLFDKKNQIWDSIFNTISNISKFVIYCSMVCYHQNTVSHYCWGNEQNSRDSTRTGTLMEVTNNQLPVLSQMCPLQGLTINYAPFTPKLKHLQSCLVKNSLKLFFLIKAAYWPNHIAKFKTQITNYRRLEDHLNPV